MKHVIIKRKQDIWFFITEYNNKSSNIYCVYDFILINTTLFYFFKKKFLLITQVLMFLSNIIKINKM